MTRKQPRQPKGQPVGGQFAGKHYSEDDINIADQTPTEYTPPSHTTYNFPATLLPKAVASIEKANRRAATSNITDENGNPQTIGYTTKTYRKEHKSHGLTISSEDWIELALDRPTLHHDGWTFTGTLTWDDTTGALITHMVPGQELNHRPNQRTCDACGQTRDRNDTYVIVRDGEQLQVGRNCLQKFLGIKPTGLWLLGWEPDIPEHYETEGPSGRVRDYRYDSEYALAITLAVVEEHGWVSKSAAAEYGTMPTADRVRKILTRDYKTVDEQQHYEAINQQAHQRRDEASTLLEETRNTESNGNEYLTNLNAVASSPDLSLRNIGLFASIVAAKQQRENKTRKTNRKEKSQHIGQPKDKLADHTVEVLAVNYSHSQWGTTSIIEMLDTDGNVIKWFASNDPDVTVGKSYTMKGTIKEHSEYQGIHETVVTRAKLESTEPEEAWEPEPGWYPIRDDAQH